MGDTARATKLLRQSLNQAVRMLQRPAQKVSEELRTDESDDGLEVSVPVNPETDSTEDEADGPKEASRPPQSGERGRGVTPQGVPLRPTTVRKVITDLGSNETAKK